MTKDQWDLVEKKLLCPYAVVRLNADGYEVALQMQRNKMQLVIAVYVYDKIRLEWMEEDCEIRRKFYRCSTRSLLTRKEREKLKRVRKPIRKEIVDHATYCVYTPYWGSFRTLKRHLTKNCSTIVPYEEGNHAE